MAPRRKAERDGSHARACPPVAQRVNIIAELMERLEWERGKTAVRLAAEWGVAVNTVEQSAAEASRRVIGDKDEAIRDITAGARALYRKAVQAGDAKAAKAIGDLWADIAGAKAPTKQETGVVLVDVGEATPAKAREIMGDLFSSEAAPDKQAARDESEK